jgi:GTP-binding protein
MAQIKRRKRGGWRCVNTPKKSGAVDDWHVSAVSFRLGDDEAGQSPEGRAPRQARVLPCRLRATGSAPGWRRAFSNPHTVFHVPPRGKTRRKNSGRAVACFQSIGPARAKELCMFVDTATIKIKAGDGGDGAVAFHREKYVASGGPSGGDGGHGGHVLFEAADNLSTLSDFRHRRSYRAENGAPGGAGRRSGKSAPSLVVRVPRGTLVFESESGALLADISGDEPFVAAKGGRGGWGNAHFATPTRQAPRFAKGGAPGEAWALRLELKLLADVGLLGFPNVGKSTLISVVSEAKPLIANYHFTTVTPVLGVVPGPEGGSFVLADIPGLIEGASKGAGQGHAFLRHVERCRLLVHVLDASGSEGRDPIEDFEAINRELAAFNPELAKQPQLVAANKTDLASPGCLERLRDYFLKKNYEFFALCAPVAAGTQDLVNALRRRLSALPPVRRFEAEPLPLPDPKRGHIFELSKEGGVFRVEAPWLLRVLRRTNLDDYESLQYFQRVLQGSGVIAALEAAGIQEGDTVSIYELEFDYVP